MTGRSNVYLLTNSVTNILIDTSVSKSWNRLLKQLYKLNILHVEYLILTHTHFDHAANANRIKEKFKCSVIVHKDVAKYLKKGESNIPGGTNFFTGFLVNILSKFVSTSILKYEPCDPDIIVDFDYDLKELGFKAFLKHTPGHTIGSMSLIIDDEIAIVGDTMFGIFINSIFPPYADDIDLMIRSWGNLLDTKCIRFLPSHGTANDRSLVQKDYDRRIKSLILH